MPQNALFGWTGLIGQTLFYQLARHNLSDWSFFNSSNVDDARGQSFDTIYLACLPAQKWWANLHPQQDLATMRYVLDVLMHVKARRVFVISTVDVFQCTASLVDGEWESRLTWATHPYGQHRREFEEVVQSIYSSVADVYILRLPALFGQGLKKNALYDLLHGSVNEMKAICLDSWFQWYDLSSLSADLERMVTEGKRLLMPVSEPLQMRELVTRLFPESVALCTSKGPVVHYRFHNSSGPMMSTEEVLRRMKKWIEQERHWDAIQPAASNIGFSVKSKDAMSVLNHYGIRGMEVSPSQMGDLRGIPAIGVQGILYGMPRDFNIFQSKSAFLERFVAVLRDLSALSGPGPGPNTNTNTKPKRIVFGCPRHRDLTVSEEEAVELFQTLGDLCSQHNAVLCLEAVARAYGCTWLTTLESVLAFVDRVGHPAVLANLDSGNMCMEADPYPLESLDLNKIGHVQLAAPFLSTEWTEDAKDTARRVLNRITGGHQHSISYEAVKPPLLQEYCAGLAMFCDLMRACTQPNGNN